jgi:hypothetical protein
VRAGASVRGTAPSTPSGHRLVLVQDGCVVCVIDGHRRQAATSVARLLCRMLVSEVCIYACPPVATNDLVTGDRVLPLPESWSEVCRVTPWAGEMLAIH